jgi:hypothetical protein
LGGGYERRKIVLNSFFVITAKLPHTSLARADETIE